MPDSVHSDPLPPPIVVPCAGADLNELLSKEWLLTNRLGSYASSTVVGCNTRRYHGLLVAATTPPVGRRVTLSTLMEHLTVDDVVHELATNEFQGSFSPEGFRTLVEYRDGPAPTFVYRCGPAELTKEIVLADSANAVAVRYTLRGARGRLRVWPFAALRDFHHLRKVHEPHQMTFDSVENGVRIEDRRESGHPLYILCRDGAFEAKPQWWYRFLYRVDLSRGQDGQEDLYSPGSFVVDLPDGASCQFTAVLDEPFPLGFETTVERRRERLSSLAASVGPDADVFDRRLALATDAYYVHRAFPGSASSGTIVAGYHWFADWGRDAFIALPGILLSTQRHEQARDVFRTFALHVADGMIPNRFDDYANSAHYNSIDASLWFILAADRYVRATNDRAFWGEVLRGPCETILRYYREGTRFDIRADSDMLLTGGSHLTQLTWMDAKLGEEVVTPREGKAVEINALWYCAHRILAEQLGQSDPAGAREYAALAAVIGAAFEGAFWNEPFQWCNDCISSAGPDATLRPNQIFAVSLPYSPLREERQRRVVAVIQDLLLTPMGLRTLSPDDPRYRRRCAGSWESRDRAYHQGTVWAWLIGPFIEAYLKVEHNRPPAVAQAKAWLAGFEEHLREAGIGHISEIFDGDSPHTPRGCIAQAWSVGEVLRARMLVKQAEGK